MSVVVVVGQQEIQVQMKNKGLSNCCEAQITFAFYGRIYLAYLLTPYPYQNS